MSNISKGGIPRREFFRRAGSGAAAAALATGCAPRGTKGRLGLEPRFELGLASYTFREFSLRQTLAMTRRLGLKRIVLKSFHLPLESSPDFIRKTAEEVRAADFDLYGCGVVYMTNRDEVARAFAYAAAAGMSMIVGAPDHEVLPEVEERVEATGVRLAIHNHGPGDRLFPSPDDAYERIRGLHAGIGICLDAGHTMRCGIDPSACARRCADRLLDVHIKDVSAADQSGDTVEIGRGVIDIPRLLRTLIEIDYDRTAAFEYEKDGSDPLPGVAESVGFVRGALSAMREGAA